MSKRVSLTFEPMLPLAKSIHRVPEHKLSKRRLLSQREREKADLRAGELLENAERELWRAAEKYMQRGGSSELAIETVESIVRQESSDKKLQIKEGPELNRAVAEAIGLVCVAQTLDGLPFFIDPREGASAKPAGFFPSTDLNDAFQAAGTMFNKYALRKRGVAKYEFECYFDGDDGISRCGEYSTPCLAICAAIILPKCR